MKLNPLSGLNAGLYRVNLKNDPHCVCGHLFEDAIHFFLECPLYQHDRNSLFNYFNNIVPISIEYIAQSQNIRKLNNLKVFGSKKTKEPTQYS
jgi:hypothetical protein